MAAAAVNPVTCQQCGRVFQPLQRVLPAGAATPNIQPRSCAKCRTFGIGEMLEKILSYLPRTWYLRVQAVSKDFRRCILSMTLAGEFETVSARLEMPLIIPAGEPNIKFNQALFARTIPEMATGNKSQPWSEFARMQSTILGGPRSKQHMFTLPFLARPGVDSANFSASYRYAVQGITIHFDEEHLSSAVLAPHSGAWTRQYLSDPALPVALQVVKNVKSCEGLPNGGEKVMKREMVAWVTVQPCPVGDIYYIAQTMERRLRYTTHKGLDPADLDVSSPTGVDSNGYLGQGKMALLYSIPQHTVDTIEKYRYENA